MDVTRVGGGWQNMAAHGRSGEKWQSALSEQPVFAELRHKGGNGEASRQSAAQLRNLLCSLDGDLLVWNPERKCFHIVRLAAVGADIAPEAGQIFLCKNIPLFEVTQVLLSPARRHVALIGSKGLMVLEVPERWGKNSEFEGGEKVVNCRTIPFAERMLSSSTSLVLKQAIWYPSETDEPHLVLLTSDNTIRIYSLQDHLKPIKVIPLSNSDEETSFTHMGRSYKASLGETAVACDFGPLVAYPKSHGVHGKEETAYPLYILYENGETFLIYISLHNSKNIGKLVGPLPMHPAAEDNYGYDACAVLCLPCVPSILVIATESGLLYHCVVLEAEDDDEHMSNKSWSSSDIDPVPSLYVCECVELELALKITATEDEGPMDSDFSCPIRLHRDAVCPSRYHCTHMAGVHSVGLTWFENLKTFLAASDEDMDSFQELATEQKCLVEHILCTKPLPCRLPAPIQGFWIISDLALGTAMICVTSEFECITRPLQTTICQPSPLLLCSQVDQSVLETSHVLADVKGSFESHIRSILSRNSANPLLLNASNKDSSPPPEECLQLLSRAIQVFREEYALKEDMAREEIQRRVKLLKVQKEKQMEDLQRCKKERTVLKETAEGLAEKYEEAKDKQEALINRMKAVLHNFQTQLCVLSDSERDMKKELQTMSQQLHQLENAIKQIKMKNDYQEKQIEKKNRPSVSNLTLNNDQKKTIQNVLKEEGEHIQDMVKQINTIRSHVNF